MLPRVTAYDDARARLPKDVVALCDATLAEYRAYWSLRAAGQVKGHEYHKSKAAYAAMERALERVGLGTHKARSQPMSSITSEQRDVITLLSEDEIPIDPLIPLRGYDPAKRRGGARGRRAARPGEGAGASVEHGGRRAREEAQGRETQEDLSRALWPPRSIDPDLNPIPGPTASQVVPGACSVAVISVPRHLRRVPRSALRRVSAGRPGGGCRSLPRRSAQVLYAAGTMARRSLGGCGAHRLEGADPDAQHPRILAAGDAGRRGHQPTLDQRRHRARWGRDDAIGLTPRERSEAP